MKEVSYEVFLDPDEQERLRMYIQTDKGKVMDMVVQYESFLEQKWIPIVRYDCAHGFFHRDLLYPSGEKEKQAINMSSMEDALNYAEQDLKDRWEFYKTKYLNKKKK